MEFHEKKSLKINSSWLIGGGIFTNLFFICTSFLPHTPFYLLSWSIHIPKNPPKTNPNIILGTFRRRDPDELSSSGYSSSAVNAEYYPVSTETMDTGDYELYDPRIHAKPRLQIQPRKTIRPEVVNYPSIQISLLLYPAWDISFCV